MLNHKTNTDKAHFQFMNHFNLVFLKILNYKTNTKIILTLTIHEPFEFSFTVNFEVQNKYKNHFDWQANQLENYNRLGQADILILMND